jgi:hypothetical protein
LYFEVLVIAMNKYLAVCFGCLLCAFANSQILNIDKSDTADYIKKAKANFNLSSGLEIDKQKITLSDATNTMEALLQKNRELFICAASYRFTYNGPDDILNAGFIHLRYRHNYKNKIQPEFFTQYQWDNKRGLEHRYLAGSNIRYNFFKGAQFDFNTGIGLMFEEEIWNYDAVDSNLLPANAPTLTNHKLKFNSYVRFDWKPNNNSDITFNIFFQTAFNALLPRVAPHVQWNVNAGKHLAFSISFTGVYDAKPVVPIPNFYYSLSNSLTVKF